MFLYSFCSEGGVFLVTLGAVSEMLQLWDLTGMSWLSGVSELTHVFCRIQLVLN